jgi:hypothetical protein
LLERFLLAVGFRGGRLRDDRTLIDPVSEFPQLPRPLSGEKGKLFRSHLRELADPDKPRLIECLGHLRPDAWEPLGFQRTKEITLTARSHLQKAGRLSQF